MPCDSLTTQSVALKNAMPSIVKSTLTALGWNITASTAADVVAKKDNYTLEWTKGVGVTVKGMRMNEKAIAHLTREYSKHAVTWAASRAGWQVKTTGENKLAVQRR